MAETYLTKEGLKKLEAEHKSLMSQKHQLTEEVSRAAAMGDLRENAEYHAARERLQHVSSRLAELDDKLQRVTLIDGLKVKADEARVGAKVTLRDLQTKEEFSYLLVGPDEADPPNGKLSMASPLGKAMLGKKQGEEFKLVLPKALITYKVLKIERG